ncbi:MAG: nucleoside triphosphate pyrophosphatase [Pseudomonadota bacterium]
MSKLILASGSEARHSMLKNAGFDFDVIPSDVDEQKIKNNFKGKDNFSDLAQELAYQKAISAKHANSFVIGSDQLLIFNNEILSKAKTKEEARDKLLQLKNNTHILISSVVVVKDNEIVFSSTDHADLTMRDFRDEFLDQYLDKAGDILTKCVGSYALESYGLQLFSEIKGDYFTILGMPLLPLSNFLQDQGHGL